ncbi:hypothetical protein NC653_028621 [Populus alba x Populus x berolinensis]|uniref:Uncharacterized protein n=1 Tax=Populus alba x Populus x berolinensis TaxID=444605 RepID=A0AAD6M0I2_9ROSI|nr:hypothetical protein NC653_028621 [Populus alba x Populus x berolinensis]
MLVPMILKLFVSWKLKFLIIRPWSKVFGVGLNCFRTLFVPIEMLFMSCKFPELLYFTCKYCYCCDNRICQSSVLLNLQELLQSVHNSITFKILPETEIDSSDQE